MNIKNRYSWAAGFIIGIFALQGNAAESWNIGNNSVTYSESLANIALGGTGMQVALSQLNLSTVATKENVGTAADYVLSSVVLSMNGVVVGSIKYDNFDTYTVSPTFTVTGSSTLSFGSDVTAPESYSSSTPIGEVAAGGTYSDPNVSIVGSVAPKTVTIEKTIDRDLSEYLGDKTILTTVAFPVTGAFVTEGTDFSTRVALKGSADIQITYNYEYVPEPSSVALITLGFAALALRRKRKTV